MDEIKFSETKNCGKHEKELSADERLKLENSRIKNLSKKQKIAILVGVCAIIGIAILLCLAFCNNWFDPNSRKGHWDGKTQEQIQKELDAVVEEGTMNISIANTIRFFNSNSERQDNGLGLARIDNIENNHVDQKIKLVFEGTNEVIYESGAIAPGSYIENIRLNRYIEPGVYKLNAIFIGYDQESHKETGSLGCVVNLYIEEG